MDNQAVITYSLLGMLGLTLCSYMLTLQDKKKRHRRFKVRPINKARKQSGGYQYYKKMRTWDEEQYFKYTRMNKSSFNKLLSFTKPHITKQYRSDGISADYHIAVIVCSIFFDSCLIKSDIK